ncbi:hypothetical protein K3495_g16666, partial [Podosphaera aphanis]
MVKPTKLTAVPNPLTVELNVPGNVHKRFHVELVKRAGNDPFPSQKRDDAQNIAITDDLDEPEFEVESILRARTIRRGRGRYRQALVKWTGWVEPSWEPLEYINETKALDDFERKYGPISDNDGPSAELVGTFFGPPEEHTKARRRQRKRRGIVTADGPNASCSSRYATRASLGNPKVPVGLTLPAGTILEDDDL